MADEKKQKCFVIMPFTVRKEDLERYHGDRNHWKEVYYGLIVPAVEKAGLLCERDDEDSGSRLITENICRKLEEADVILCDLSASNPNVYLELGWALRADKKYVLIKDDVTPFNFDLNQCSTCEYSHMLQPSEVKKTIGKLASALEATIGDDGKRYSIVSKLSLSLGAIEAVKGGDVETGMLEQLLKEVQSLKRGLPSPTARSVVGIVGHRTSITSAEELAQWLPGTSWRKRGSDERMMFTDTGIITYVSRPGDDRSFASYLVGPSRYELRVYWGSSKASWDFVFGPDYSTLVQVGENSDVWELIDA